MDLEAVNAMESVDEMNVVEHLSRIEERLIAAFVAGDPSFHEEVLAGDWVTIDVAGRMLDSRCIENVPTGGPLSFEVYGGGLAVRRHLDLNVIS